MIYMKIIKAMRIEQNKNKDREERMTKGKKTIIL